MLLAIDYDIQTGNINGGEHHNEPLPAIPDNHARLLAADYAHLDVVRTVPAKYSTPEPVQVAGEPVLLQSEILSPEGTVLVPAQYITPMVTSQPEPVLVSPERTELVKAGVVIEYERRRDAIVAGRPKAVRVYSVSEYVEAVEKTLDEAAQAHGYDDIVSACSYAGAPNRFQAESQAFVAWRGNVWAACYAAQANPPAVQPTPAEFVAAILATHPAP